MGYLSQSFDMMMHRSQVSFSTTLYASMTQADLAYFLVNHYSQRAAQVELFINIWEK